MTKLEKVLDKRVLLGEGPAWDDRLGLLFWVDIRGMRLHAYNPESGKDREYRMPSRIGTVTPWRDDRVAVALADGIYSVMLSDGRLECLVKIEEDLPANRFNDGKCDPAGRLWAGTMNDDETGERSGRLYRIDPGLKVSTYAEEVKVSNGLAHSPDGKFMYYIDSGNPEVDVFDYDMDTGDAINRRKAFDIPEDTGAPDGMTVDAEGMLWVAHWGGRRVARYNPQTGAVLSVIEVPAERTSACAFGGRDLDELYITTAGGDTYSQHDQGGCLFRIKPGVRGFAAHRFGG